MATTTNYGWTTPDDTDLVKDGAAAIRTLGSSIDTSFVADQGDLLLGGASDIFEPLAIGATATVLTSNGTTASWVAPAGGGKVLQVVQGTLTSTFSTTSTSATDTGLTVSITPSSATSKVMVIVSAFCTAARSGSGDNATSEWTLLVGATQLQRMNLSIYTASSTSPELNGGLNFAHLDSPNTTSATTYKVQGRTLAGSTTASMAASATIISSIIAMEIGA
jgi:hypothetical protein